MYNYNPLVHSQTFSYERLSHQYILPHGGRSEEDGGYVADIPDLKHCSAFGETAEQALFEVLQAKIAWLETAKAQKKPVPEPKYKPMIYQVAS